MNEGDKVRRVKGDPLGAVGIIETKWPFKEADHLKEHPFGLKGSTDKWYYTIRQEDGSTFDAPEDDLEKIE